MTHFHSQRRQNGAVLIVSMLFLVILTMLGVTAMTGTTFEERMSGNARDNAVAFQAAEAALRDARAEILVLPYATRGASLSPASFPDPTDDKGSCTLGLCQPRKFVPTPNNVGDQLPDIPANVSWTGDPSVPYGTYTGALAMKGLTQPPRYIIELFCPTLLNVTIGGPPGTNCRIYRFTARGYGKNPNTQVTLQEVFYREWNL
jgi:type IV pilus assembly protein PilX